MGYDFVKVEKAGARATVIMCRPEQLNAINLSMAAELEDALRVVGRDDGVRAVVLTGEGSYDLAAWYYEKALLSNDTDEDRVIANLSLLERARGEEAAEDPL